MPPQPEARCSRCGLLLRATPAIPYLRRPGAIPALAGVVIGSLGALRYEGLCVLGILGAVWCLHLLAVARPHELATRRRRPPWLAGAVTAGLLTIAAILVVGYATWLSPLVVRARRRDSRLAVANTFRILAAAEADFAAANGGGRFSSNLAQLASSPSHLGLGVHLLVRGDTLRHFGYTYRYFPHGPKYASYRIVAHPDAAGAPCFASNATGVVRRLACPG